jgi:DNA-binding MarR family transcriptional regulator
MYMQRSDVARVPTKPDDGFCAIVAQECIANRVRLLNRAVSSMYDEALRPHGLHITQMSILVVVSMLGEASPGDVGRILCLEKSTLSRTLDRLRAHGWIDVLPGRDARSMRVRITAKGTAKLRSVSSAWRRTQRKAQQILGDDAVHALGKASVAVAKAARARRV